MWFQPLLKQNQHNVSLTPTADSRRTHLHDLANQAVEQPHELCAWQLNLLLQLIHCLVLQPNAQ